ncbi:AAA family ATPase [Amycolatopsis sp. NPDC102389]|uniref:AAA family ATPase n=1 Tax=Amycolatopsis sp. NPDC102389 TaxID=3363941 RepID=UPI0038103A33
MTQHRETVLVAQQELGRVLAHWRGTAGHGQHGLVDLLKRAVHNGDAPRVHPYTRSSLANFEAGRQRPDRLFCEWADATLKAGGQIVLAYEAMEQAVATLHERSRPTATTNAAEWRRGDHHVAQAPAGSRLDDVIHNAFADSDAPESGALEGQVLAAHQLATEQDHALSMTLVTGFAGSGKGSFAEFLAKATRWAQLNKDTQTRPVVEQLLLALGGDRHDRHSELYLEKVRPYEYRALMDTAMKNLDAGVSVVVDAPFIRELGDDAWMARLQNNCRARGATLSVIWVRCDVESMYDYLSYRAAPRDTWKLENWQEYIAGIDPDFRPSFPHYLVDNRLNAATTLVEQADRIVKAMRHGE